VDVDKFKEILNMSLSEDSENDTNAKNSTLNISVNALAMVPSRKKLEFRSNVH